MKAKVAPLDAGPAVLACHAEVTPGVSAALAVLQALLPPTDACEWPAWGVKGGGDGKEDRVCRAAAPTAVLCVGRSANGWECGE